MTNTSIRRSRDCPKQLIQALDPAVANKFMKIHQELVVDGAEHQRITQERDEWGRMNVLHEPAIARLTEEVEKLRSEMDENYSKLQQHAQEQIEVQNDCGALN